MKEYSCISWGSTDYKTFDGKVFIFPYNCSYYLFKDTFKFTQLSILTKAADACQESEEKCHKIITMDYYNEQFRFTQDSNGNPALEKDHDFIFYQNLIGFTMEKAEDYLLVSLTYLGIKMKWDGKYYFELTVPESYWGKTEGLCGTLNGNPTDDLPIIEIPSEYSTTKLETVGRFKYENLFTEKKCEESFGQFKVCNDKMKSLGIKHCKELFDHENFKECKKLSSFNKFRTSCVRQYCRYPDSNKYIEQTLDIFTKNCIEQGKMLHFINNI